MTATKADRLKAARAEMEEAARARVEAFRYVGPILSGEVLGEPVPSRPTEGGG